MPSVTTTPRSNNGLIKFTNGHVLRGLELIQEDLWVSSRTGKIIASQAAFYDDKSLPDEIVDLGGRILAPGMIDCQLNGAFGFSFSTLLDDANEYKKKVNEINQLLVATGVTSYLPTLTTQRSELYREVLPYLGPSGRMRLASDGSESLGAHCEGPFLNPNKNGIHNVDVMLEAHTFSDLEECYGAKNLTPEHHEIETPIKMVTAAPERGNMSNLITELTQRGIVYSIGHSEATYEDASQAVANGATMITHLFNAMRPLHHRNPGIFGVLGLAADAPKPFFGVIADGIHLHPTTTKIAYDAYPEGFILVTDAMHLTGLPDGSYPWVNGDQETPSTVVKKGSKLLLGGSETIAGSAVTLLECVNNFLEWTGQSIPQALRAVTATPAKMLHLEGVKGSLEQGADADLIVLSEEDDGRRLRLDEVWKFGTMVARHC